MARLVQRKVGGRPLDPSTRAFMEGRFGADFGAVQVHADADAAQSAGQLGALAYTIGRDIYFAAGRYEPTSQVGRRLLAHELAHTVQQGAATAVRRAEPIDGPDLPLEQEADRAADAVLDGREARLTGGRSAGAPQLQPAGNARQMVARPIPGGRIEVTRTLEEQPCTRVPATQVTAPGDLLFFDPDAESFGIRFRYCRGPSEVVVDSSLRYGRLRSDAERLLDRVVRGGDPLTEVRRAVEQTQLIGGGSVVATVSGTLRAELRGTTGQGLTAREYQVDGLLRLTPRGWSLELGAQYRRLADDLSGEVTTVTFTPRANVGPVQAEVGVERTEQRPTGGAPSVTTTLRGRVSVRTGDRTGFSLTGTTDAGGSFFITFGTLPPAPRIPSVPSVECYVCNCPPPRPHFSCVTVIDPHPEVVVVQTPGREVVQLHYNYDSAVPQDRDVYDAQRTRIAGLIGQRYTVTDIAGFASPEASVEYNRRLGERRATRARDDLLATLAQSEVGTGVALPSPRGVGELLGERAAGGEARNAALIAELGARLRGLSEDQQLDLLGIDPQGLSQAEREDVRRRIDAFLRGTEEGRRLGQRARWERIFPFLRRVEVTLVRSRVTETRTVPLKRTAAGCNAETLRWARENLPALPTGRRLPTESGRC